MTKTRWWAVCGVAIALMVSVRPGKTQTAAFELREKDHICIIGNTLADRMQHDGWLETLLQARFPKHELVIRNLGFSGDEIATRLRSKNFGTPDEWLSGRGEPIGGYEANRFATTNTQADVIFAFFGYNESFAGKAGSTSSRRPDRVHQAHAGQKYNGKTRPAARAVLADRAREPRRSQPARRQGEQRAPGALHARDGRGRQASTASPSSICSRRAVSSTPQSKAPLTINGIHLNATATGMVGRRSSTARCSAIRRSSRKPC